MENKIEKQLKEIITYQNIQCQIMNKILIQLNTTNKLLQNLINKNSKEELNGNA